jgi:AraC-like DNA-binding protein
LAAGFSDQSHLSNTFKRRLSMTPAACRNSFAPRKRDPMGCSDRTRS